MSTFFRARVPECRTVLPTVPADTPARSEVIFAAQPVQNFLVVIYLQRHRPMLFCPYCANNLTIGDDSDTPEKCW